MKRKLIKKPIKFLDIKARVFQNKSNGQISITLPKKQLKKIMKLDNPEVVNQVKIPKKVPIRIFSWEEN